MPSMPRPNKQAEDIFEGIMGEYHNVSRKISIKQPKLIKQEHQNPFNSGNQNGQDTRVQETNDKKNTSR